MLLWTQQMHVSGLGKELFPCHCWELRSTTAFENRLRPRTERIKDKTDQEYRHH